MSSVLHEIVGLKHAVKVSVRRRGFLRVWDAGFYVVVDIMTVMFLKSFSIIERYTVRTRQALFAISNNNVFMGMNRFR